MLGHIGAKEVCNVYGVMPQIMEILETYFCPFQAMDDQISLVASTRTSAAGGDHYSERAWSKLRTYY